MLGSRRAKARAALAAKAATWGGEVGWPVKKWDTKGQGHGIRQVAAEDLSLAQARRAPAEPRPPANEAAA